MLLVNSDNLNKTNKLNKIYIVPVWQWGLGLCQGVHTVSRVEQLCAAACPLLHWQESHPLKHNQPGIYFLSLREENHE